MNFKQTRALRKKLGLTQEEFWGRVGFSQSGGCRYEYGRPIPRYVRMLLLIAYGNDAERKAILDVLEFVR